MKNIKTKAKLLDNSTKIDLCLSFRKVGIFNTVLDSFFSTVKKKRIHRKKYRDCFNCIVSNIIYNYRIDKLKFVSVGLNKEFFLKEANTSNIKYDIFIELFNWLEKEEFIIVHKGFNKPNYSRHTRMIGTEAFNSIFKYKKNINYQEEFKSTKPEIILKNRDKKSIKFKKSLLNEKRKKVVVDYNSHFKYNVISYKGKILPPPILYRIFNNSNFKLGGRFYGGYFQQLSKNNRKNIFINGNETVELDFNCLHINLLYNKINKTFKNDAYDLPTFPAKKFRKSIKLIVLIMINSRSLDHAKKSIQYGINTGKIKNLNPSLAIEEILVKHSLIKRFFFKDLGLKLQYRESLICENIVKIFLNRKHPITILPIHDGFICEKHNKNKLLRAMNSSFSKISNNHKIIIKEVI
jgi:hypothetical protein